MLFKYYSIYNSNIPFRYPFCTETKLATEYSVEDARYIHFAYNILLEEAPNDCKL